MLHILQARYIFVALYVGGASGKIIMLTIAIGDQYIDTVSMEFQNTFPRKMNFRRTHYI